ncbi:MAG: hypothetical protein WBA74_06970 [Cyclobacteriaceae bacterium]
MRLEVPSTPGTAFEVLSAIEAIGIGMEFARQFDADDLAAELFTELLDELDVLLDAADMPLRESCPILTREADRAWRSSVSLAAEIDGLRFGLSGDGDRLVEAVGEVRQWLTAVERYDHDGAPMEVCASLTPPPSGVRFGDERTLLLLKRCQDVVMRLRKTVCTSSPIPVDA